jgi:microcompartment protein CcmK/EutM
MKIYRVVGSVTLSRCHASYRGARLLAAEPLDAAAIGGPTPIDPDLLIVWDELGAGLGSDIAVSDGGEAAQPFRPALKPVDAYCSALLDTIQVDSEIVKRLKF